MSLTVSKIVKFLISETGKVIIKAGSRGKMEFFNSTKFPLSKMNNLWKFTIQHLYIVNSNVVTVHLKFVKTIDLMVSVLSQ